MARRRSRGPSQKALEIRAEAKRMVEAGLIESPPNVESGVYYVHFEDEEGRIMKEYNTVNLQGNHWTCDCHKREKGPCAHMSAAHMYQHGHATAKPRVDAPSKKPAKSEHKCKPWELATTWLLTSALEKAIRRGEVNHAVSLADKMIDQGLDTLLAIKVFGCVICDMVPGMDECAALAVILKSAASRRIVPEPLELYKIIAKACRVTERDVAALRQEIPALKKIEFAEAQDGMIKGILLRAAFSKKDPVEADLIRTTAKLWQHRLSDDPERWEQFLADTWDDVDDSYTITPIAWEMLLPGVDPKTANIHNATAKNKDIERCIKAATEGMTDRKPGDYVAAAMGNISHKNSRLDVLTGKPWPGIDTVARGEVLEVARKVLRVRSFNDRVHSYAEWFCGQNSKVDREPAW